MSIFGAGTNDFANLTGLDEGEYASFNDIEVAGKIYLKEPDEDTGFNSVLITNQENISGVNNENNIVNNLTGFNDNWIITLGTGEDTFEPILNINPQNGLTFDSTGGSTTISWNELSFLNNATSNIQDQINGITAGVARWGAFWSTSTQTNPTANAVNLVSYTNADASNNDVSYNNSSRLQVSNAGVYLVVASFQLNKSAGSTDEEVFFWLRKNGTDIPASGYKDNVKNVEVILTATWMLPLQANDYVEIAWFSSDTNMELLFIPAGTGTPVYPSSPSALVSVNQISTFNSQGGGTSSLPLTYFPSTGILSCDMSFNSVGRISTTRSINASNAVFSGTAGATTIFTNTHPRYSGSNSLNLASANDYMPAIYYQINYMRKNGNVGETITGLKTFTDLTTMSKLLVNDTIATNNLSASGTLSVSGNTTLSYLRTTGNIDCSGNMVINCGTAGGTFYGFYNLVDFIKERDQNSVNLANNAQSKANDAMDKANEAMNKANDAMNKSNDAMNKANDAQSTADGANIVAGTALALAGTANAGVIALGASVATITGTTIPVLQGQVSTLQGQMTAEQLKTQNLFPTAIGEGTKCNGAVSVYNPLIPPPAPPKIILNPTGASYFEGGGQFGSVLDANEIQTDVIYSNSITNSGNLITGTINTGISGTQNLDGGWINIGHLGSIITIGGVLYSPFNNPATYWTQFVEEV